MPLFTPVLAASGLMNFFGEGYWYHKFYKLVPGFSLRGVTFVSKTTTLEKRPGNMPLEFTQPKEWKPACIWTNLRRGITLNAVGLSGPGAEALLERHQWQSRTEEFWISFMAIQPSTDQRIQELTDFIKLLQKYRFNANFGLQINLSCPNQGGVHPATALTEASLLLEQTRVLNAPVMLKISATTDPALAVEISKHPRCSAISVSNTIPFGAMPHLIPWTKFFGGNKPSDSPLFSKVGMGGGLSGPPLFPLTLEWVKQAKKLGISGHLNAGGGIFSRTCVKQLKDAGADSISIGTVALHRPWRVKGIISEAHRQFAHDPQA